MYSVQKTQRIFLYLLFPVAIAAGMLFRPTHADVFSGYQGSIKGGIPAYTRDVKHNKPFWCNQYKLVRKICEVVSQSENGRVAIVRMVPTTWKCPNGIWGVVDRTNGDAMELIPAAKMSLEQYCSKAFSAGFVKSQNRKSLADVVMYYNGKPIDSFEYLEE